MKPLRLAVDTNVLLDLAEEVDAVLDTFALLDQRLPGNDVLVVPSVLDELAFLCDSAETEQIRRAALRAMKLRGLFARSSGQVTSPTKNVLVRVRRVREHGTPDTRNL
jgi:hypothetical protein